MQINTDRLAATLVIAAVDRWASDYASNDLQQYRRACSDFALARRNPAAVPILVMAAILTGKEPREVLKAVYTEAHHRRTSARWQKVRRAA